MSSPPSKSLTGEVLETEVPCRSLVSTTRTRQLLLRKDFGLIWWSQLIAQVGDGITKLALLWFVYAVTGSPVKTTMIGILQTLPPIIFGPIIGVFIDRLPKKFLLIGTDLTRAILIGLIPCAITAENFTVEFLYLLVFLNSVATAVFGPALYASVPFIVARSELTAANALLQGTSSFGVIFGPALSGIGIAMFSSQEVLCINAITYLGSASCLFFVALPRRVTAPHTSENPETSTLGDLLEGLRFAFLQQKIILLLILTAGLYVFGLSAFSTLLPVFGMKMWGLGPVEVGSLTSALGVGLLFASVSLVWVTKWDLWRRIRLLMTSSMITALAMWGLIGVDGFLVTALFICIIGAGTGVLTPIEWGVVQEVTPPHLIGRVLTLYGTGAMLAAITGMLTFGWIAEKFGEITTIVGIGCMLVLTALTANWVSQQVRDQRLAGLP